MITIVQHQVIVQLKQKAKYNLVLMRPSNQKADLVFNGATLGASNLIIIDKKQGKSNVVFNLEVAGRRKRILYCE